MTARLKRATRRESFSGMDAAYSSRPAGPALVAAAFDSIRVEVSRATHLEKLEEWVTTGRDMIASYFRFSGTFTAELTAPDLLSLAPTGGRLELLGMDRSEIRDELITRHQIFWDIAELSRRSCLANAGKPRRACCASWVECLRARRLAGKSGRTPVANVVWSCRPIRSLRWLLPRARLPCHVGPTHKPHTLKLVWRVPVVILCSPACGGERALYASEDAGVVRAGLAADVSVVGAFSALTNPSDAALPRGSHVPATRPMSTARLDSHFLTTVCSVALALAGLLAAPASSRASTSVLSPSPVSWDFGNDDVHSGGGPNQTFTFTNNSASDVTSLAT